MSSFSGTCLYDTLYRIVEVLDEILSILLPDADDRSFTLICPRFSGEVTLPVSIFEKILDKRGLSYMTLSDDLYRIFTSYALEIPRDSQDIAWDHDDTLFVLIYRDILSWIPEYTQRISPYPRTDFCYILAYLRIIDDDIHLLMLVDISSREK